MKQRSQHKPAAEQSGAAQERAESDRAERTPMKHGTTNQSAKRPMRVPAEDGRAAAHEGQQPQNQQRLGQHQNSRKQP